MCKTFTRKPEPEPAEPEVKAEKIKEKESLLIEGQPPACQYVWAI